jgi:putative FmdB family regulatory protein
MPLYEYQCEACGHRFEVIVKFSDPPLEKCPICGGHVHKLFSSPAFQFKGTGWYVTDYAKKDQGAPAKTGGATDDSSGKEKGENAGKSEGGEKSDKHEKQERKDKGDKGSSGSESSSSSSSPASSSTSDASSGSTGNKSGSDATGGNKSGSST